MTSITKKIARKTPQNKNKVDECCNTKMKTKKEKTSLSNQTRSCNKNYYPFEWDSSTLKGGKLRSE